VLSVIRVNVLCVQQMARLEERIELAVCFFRLVRDAPVNVVGRELVWRRQAHGTDKIEKAPDVNSVVVGNVVLSTRTIGIEAQKARTRFIQEPGVLSDRPVIEFRS